MNAYELTPGTIFSCDEGRTWLTCEIANDAQDNSDDTIIWAHDNTGIAKEIRIGSWTKVLTP